MGDRVTMKCVDGRGLVSPAVYAHWQGRNAPDIIRKAIPFMRKNDADYSAAALAYITF